MGTRLGYDEIKEGDLVFFSDEGSDEVSFGGIYVGGGKMIACLMPGTLVREVDITTDYYRENFFGGCRNGVLYFKQPAFSDGDNLFRIPGLAAAL